MLAAMPPTPPPTPEPGEPRIRDRGDACPGALRLHPADDGRLARLRLPAGRLTARQAEVLARAAETLGDGRISITSRGNAELRGLGEGCGAELAELLAGAGLLPSPTHERVRNIVASPGAGLDGLGRADVQLWARELDAALCAEPRAASLSGRFLFLLDDGRGDVAGLGGDVSLIAGQDGSALLRLGSRGFRLAAGDAVRAALAAALAFLDAAEAAGNGAWRPHELPDEHVPDWAGALARAGITAEPVPVPPLPASRPPAPGPLGEHSLHVLAPLGRLTAAQLRALLPADELRLTPWRGVVVVETPTDRPTDPATDLAATDPAPTHPDRLRDLEAHGLITRPDAPGAGVTACTGRPGCAKSLADVRADALAAPPGPLPVHFSGCARRCGHPYGAWINVLATGDDSYLVDGVPTPRTSLTAAVAAARGLPTHTR
ncbi:cobalamin biosynthesis protein CobG [Streptomyces sp. TLI_105]|uniref:cobalamin biosynthesis protein CobG n=1 Tax=Streptomyces sp. TLI_105 TaxID=1881019 RepID=UPI000B86B88F|nr:cobalamin biosynthesis protein CobG [Streptomyces sp. TLI_105]